MASSLEQHIDEMKSLAKMLVPYSFPLRSRQDEIDIAILKKRNIVVDGYEITVFFNSANYGDKYLETLQVFGQYFTFLPFYLVCKLAKLFLGNEHLGYTEIVHSETRLLDNTCRKIYVWTLYYDGHSNKVQPPFLGEGYSRILWRSEIPADG